MKLIPNTYWDENYEKHPAFLQKVWVQRWMELLDSNTSYAYAPPLVNIIGVLNEIVNGFQHKKGTQARTYFFLLCELERCFCTDPVLLNNYDLFFKDNIKPILDGAKIIFNSNGSEKPNIPNIGKNKKNFEEDFEKFKSNYCKTFFDELCKDNYYRNLVCRALKEYLISHEDGLEIYKEINELSKNLIIDLLTTGNYSSSFLIRQCVEIFLHKNDGKDFNARIDEFFSKFGMLNHEFVVYMRVQARHIIRNIGKIGEISFQSKIPDIIDIIERISGRKKWHPECAIHAKDFFYKGDMPNNLVFAIAQNITSEDSGNAAIKGLAKLSIAIHQAKFEHELKNFSIDSNIYVYDKTKDDLIFISSKKLRKSRYGSVGDPFRFEKIISKISDIKSNVNKVKIALSWHKEALEADTAETQFMNHWISLEQIFKTSEQTSSAYRAVLAIAKILKQQFECQILLDLWGDFKRLGVLGYPRIIAPINGTIEYSKELLYGMPNMQGLYFIPSENYQRPKLSIANNKERHDFKLQPNTIVLFKDRREVSKGEWIVGTFLNETTRTERLNLLFKGITPNTENLLYIALYQRNIESLGIDIDLGGERVISPFLIEAMRWYDRLNYYLHRDIEIINFMNNPYPFNEAIRSMIHDIARYESFFEIYRKLFKQSLSFIKNYPILPDIILFEAFRGQLPDIENMYIFFKEERKDTLVSNHPLLKLRIEQVYEFLNKKDQEELYKYFITEADRIRRARNEIVHNANAPLNIELLVSRLYKYTRLCLREIIHKLANGNTIDSLYEDQCP